MTDLKNKTLFITGASRGIGLAIALRAAKDGANIAIAAKSAEPHKHLPGTIYTAAEEIEAAGGKALPLVCDIRHEDQVQAAVAATVEKFGGIDICINNASAISLTGTEATEMKRWDLMHSINARGTFLTSKTCIPHLKKAENPHVLMLSPPLDMSPKWFAGHTAYTMAKYGMSMCVLGMAAEFKSDGVAFNALWPRTAIATAAVKFALGGDAMMQASRSVDILSDAAHLIFTKSSKEFTGNFIIDDTFLFENGVTDFEKYRVDPSKQLAPDFFVPDSSTPPPGVAETLMKGMLGQVKLASLHIHPVKSMRAIDVDRVDVETRGLVGDRRWLVTDEEGGFLTQRTCSALAKIDAVYDGAALRLSDGESECVINPPLRGDRRDVTVWNDQVNAAGAGRGADDWLSDVLGRPAHLFYMDDDAPRMTSGRWGDRRPVSFADVYPLLVATTASLAALNEAMKASGGEAVSMARFRPNIVIDGADPWAEDFWKVVRIGDIEIELVKPCDRCVMTTLDPLTGEKQGRDPLKTLSKLRRSAHPDLSGAVLFGWNAAPLGEGAMAVGDAVELVERRAEGWPLA